MNPAAPAVRNPASPRSHALPTKTGFDLREKLSLAFLSKLLSTPAGRAHLLSQNAEAEASGESRVFDQALSRVEDADLQKMISRHRTDELRHEQLFRARVAATVAEPPEVPEHLKLVNRINRDLGGILDRPITDSRGVLEAYCLLQVLEERAVTQFPLFAEALAEIDPASAQVFREVLEDEKRHLLYCAAISKRYARDEAERLEVLQRIRDVEARAFAANQVANMDEAFKRGLVRGAAAIPWKLVRQISALIRPVPHTRFWGQA